MIGVPAGRRLRRNTAAIGGVVLAAMMAACAAPPLQPRAIGPDAYEITRRFAATTSGADAKRVDVELEAAAFCGRDGRATSVLDSRTVGADPPEFPAVVVRFRCVPR